MSITKRSDKGSALTYNEMDANFDAIAERTSSTGSIIVPAGDTSSRDTSPVNGYFRYNSSLNTFEGFQNGAWGALGSGGGGGGGGDVNQNAFSSVLVAGQNTVSADVATDSLTFVAGANITLTTDATGDSITIASSGGSQDFAYTSLTGTPTEFPPSAHNQPWSTITATPTTLAGYGITDGASGVQGFTGASGTGIQGFTGGPGPQGTNGIGIAGNQGFTGIQGDRGFIGEAGAQGFQGVQSIQGTKGDIGNDGGQGTQGFQGVQSVQGLTGADGAGPQGPTGAEGFGAQGFQGVQGLAGEGVQGDTGPAGFGLQGLQGLQGELGPVGPSGVGTQGLSGGPGIQGPIGEDGGDGPEGAQGPAGSVQGLQGHQGTIGGSGIAGNQGTTGSGIQGDAGGAGVQGFLGFQGFQGVQSVQGLSGLGIQGTQGFIGNQGTIGETGEDGVGQLGSQGTQGLQGFDGITGLQGVQGFQGDLGVQGNEGFQGFDGNQGTTGLGDTGIQGQQGTFGIQGFDGPSIQGLTGATGIQGLTGGTGGTGIQGLQGLQGTDGVDATGIQGSNGNPGLQGLQGTTGTGLQGTTGTGTTGLQGLQGTTGTGLQGTTGTGLQGTTGTGTTGLQGLQGLQSIQGLQGTNGDISTMLPLAGGTMTGNITFDDSVKATFGTGNDLEIYHDSSDSFVKDNGAGNLRISSNGVGVYILDDTNDATMARFTVGGSNELFHANSLKLATSNTGIDVTGAITASGEIAANGGISLIDNKKLTFGTGDDLEIFHDGNNSYINDVGTGNIFIRGANVVLTTAGGTKYLEGGSNVLRLYHTGNQRMQTSAAGILVTGTVTADGLVFNGYSPTVDNDFNNSGSVTADDYVDYLQLGEGIATGVDISAVSVITTNWDAPTGSVYNDNKFRILAARGNGADALLASVSSPNAGYGDTTIIGNVDINGVDTKLITGIGISGNSLSLVGNVKATGVFNAVAEIFNSNQDNTAGTNQNVGYNFGLTRNDGAFKSQAGRIEVGRNRDWTALDTDVDAYMSFSAYTNNVLIEHMRLMPTGNMGIRTTMPNGSLTIADGNRAQFEFYPEYTTDANLIINFDRTTNTFQKFMTSASSHEFYIPNASTGTGATRKVAITGDGILFNADTAAANALDDYEEGTWTPSGTNLNAQGGRYTKVGNLVTCTCRYNATGGSVSANLTGLPFASVATTSYESAGGGVVTWQNAEIAAWSVRVTSSSTVFHMYKGGNSAVLTVGSTAFLTFSYIAA